MSPLQEEADALPKFEPDPGISIPDAMMASLNESQKLLMQELLKINRQISVVRQEMRWLARQQKRFDSPLRWAGTFVGYLVTATLAALASRWLGGH